MALAIENQQEEHSGLSSPWELTISNFAVSSSSDRILIALVGGQDSNASNRHVSGIAFQALGGDENFTQLREDENGGNVTTEIWYLVNPSDETADIVATWVGNTNESYLVVIEISGAAQNAPEASAGGSGGDDTPTSSLTTVADDTISFSIASSEADFASINDGQTGLDGVPWEGDQGFEQAYGGYKVHVAAGAKTLSYTTDWGTAWASSSCSIAGAVAVTPVDITKDLDYAVITDTDITKDLDYEVVAGVDIEKGLVYEVITENDITKDLVYEVVAPVDITKDLGYCVTSQVDVTKDLEYQVIITPSEITQGLDYQVVTVSEIQKALSYEVVAPNDITKDLEYDIVNWWEPASLIETIGSIVSGRLVDVYEEDGNSLILAETETIGVNPAFLYDFDFYGVAEGGEEYTSHFHAKYNGSPSHRIKLQQWNFDTSSWDNVTSNSSDFPYNADLQHYHYVLLNTVDHIDGGNIKLRIRHNTGNGNTDHTFVIDHFILEFHGHLTMDLDYEVVAPVDITKGLQYTVVVTPTDLEKALNYFVVLFEDINKVLSYEVITPIDITKGLIYTVLTSDEVTKSLDYSVLVDQDITKGLDYFVVTEIDIIKSLDYEVIGPVDITKSLQYMVITKNDIAISLAYEVVSPVGITKGLSYEVVVGVEINKTLSYTVVAQAEVTKALDYEVVAQVGITKNLTYFVTAESIDIPKSLIYFVVVDPYCPLDSPYTIKQGIYDAKANPFTRLPDKC